MIERAAPGVPRPAPTRSMFRWLAAPLLFICVLSGYLLTFNVDKPTHNADWYLRYQVTCSIVERNQFYLHPYHNDGRTGAGADGQMYTQYTLGQTTAMIPLYLLGRVLSGVPHSNCDQTVAVPITFLTAKTLDMILGALLCVLFFATARVLGYSRGIALSLSLVLAFGSALWPDVLSNLEHTMESLFLLAAAYAALRYTRARRKSPLWLLVMGLAAGLVFVTRVAGVIATPIFALYLLVLHRRWRLDAGRAPAGRSAAWRRPLMRDLAIYALGLAPSYIINGVYDMMRFGAPWRTGPKPDESFGYPPWLGIPNLLISPGKGLIWFVPALLLLPFVVRPFWRRYPLPTILFAIICGVYLFFYANINYWHGDPAWGPRYLYALLPYLILPLGELFRRWRNYRLPRRTVIVGVLAASFLVQFSAVTVSYWRNWHFIYGYHYDQVENHNWGQNLNNWWYPDQSPIVISLTGIYVITQDYVTHATLLQHPGAQRLADPYETCMFNVLGQASICLTDLDEYLYGGNWNTFTVWWLHSYPWWSSATVTTLALALLSVFLASGGALLLLVRRADRRGAVHQPAHGALWAAAAWPSNGHSYGGNGHGVNGNGANGSGGQNGSGGEIDVAALPRLAPLPGALPAAHGFGTAVAEAPAPSLVLRSSPAAAVRAVTGLLPLAVAALCSLLVYGGIVGAATAAAPRHARPLISRAAPGATARDGNWEYRVLRVQSLRAVPGVPVLPAPGHHYVIVTIQLHNLLSRPNHVRQEFFALTNTTGLAYPWVNSLVHPVAELYHLTPLGIDVPAHGILDGVIIYLVRDGPTHLELLGPGITLIPLT